MKTLPLLAALAALILAGCGEPKNDSSSKALAERRKAEAMVRMAAIRERAEAAGAAERDPELEAAAAKIEADYEAAVGNGTHSKLVRSNLSSAGTNVVSAETTEYAATAADGTAWRAVVVRENGAVTKAERSNGPAGAPENPDAAF